MDERAKTFHARVQAVMREEHCDYYQACAILARRGVAKRRWQKHREQRTQNVAPGRVGLPARDRE